MGDPEKYRSPEEVKKFIENGPIDRFQKYLLEQGISSQSEMDQIMQEVEGEIEQGVKFARESPEPEDAALFEHIYVDDNQRGEA